MPLSYAHSQGDGSNRLFDVPCEYLSKAHVTVRVDGTLVPFSWIDTYRLQTSTAPPAKSVVEVRRTTPREDRLVTFTDGSTLVQSDLNTSTLQSFFLAQEAFDQGAASMAVTEDGQFSALQRRITSLADPVTGQDAVTKSWALSTANTNLAAAVAAKDASVVARQGSETARSGSEVARTAAETARDEARAHRDTASAHRLNAQNAQAGAETARAGAEAAKVGLEAARDTAVTKAGEASGSAAAAFKSAQNAALFDPSSYYTKTISDGRFLTALSAQNDFYTKTFVDTALNNKVDKAYPQMTGVATIAGGRPTLSFSPSESNKWVLDAFTDGTFRLVDATLQTRVASFSTSGALWTKELGDLNTRIETRAADLAKWWGGLNHIGRALPAGTTGTSLGSIPSDAKRVTLVFFITTAASTALWLRLGHTAWQETGYEGSWSQHRSGSISGGGTAADRFQLTGRGSTLHRYVVTLTRSNPGSHDWFIRHEADRGDGFQWFNGSVVLPGALQSVLIGAEAAGALNGSLDVYIER